MNPPKIISIDGIDVAIKIRPLDDTDAEFLPSECAIILSTYIIPQRIRRLLMHEIIHAVLWICCQGISDRFKQLEENEIGEAIAEQIGERIYRVMEDNPELVKYLWGWDNVAL